MFLITGHFHPGGHLLVAALKVIAYSVVVPLVVAIMLLAFAATLLDFAWFQLHSAVTRKRHRKALWEF